MPGLFADLRTPNGVRPRRRWPGRRGEVGGQLVGLNGVARVTNHVYLRAGYEVLFISGVALAPNQAAAIQGGTYQVDTDGSVIVHGGNAGVEIRF